MIDLSALATCTDLTSEHARQAASSATEIRILLKRVVEIAKPGEGCPKVLMAIAHLVGQPWVEGDLRVELSGDESSTTLIVMCEYGVGIRERLMPASRFAVPLDEFERALELAPRLVLPLRISDEAGKLVLTPLSMPEARVKTVPPPELDVDSTSLGDGERKTAPPPVEDERKTAPPPVDELIVVDEASPEELVEATPAPAELTKTAPPPDDELQVVDEATPEDFEDGVHAARMESGPVPSSNNLDPPAEEQRISNVHTRPTVRRMVAVDAPAVAAMRRRDPRREED